MSHFSYTLKIVTNRAQESPFKSRGDFNNKNSQNGIIPQLVDYTFGGLNGAVVNATD
jgi:hypothetical protein